MLGILGVATGLLAIAPSRAARAPAARTLRLPTSPVAGPVPRRVAIPVGDPDVLAIAPWGEIADALPHVVIGTRRLPRHWWSPVAPLSAVDRATSTPPLLAASDPTTLTAHARPRSPVAAGSGRPASHAGHEPVQPVGPDAPAAWRPVTDRGSGIHAGAAARRRPTGRRRPRRSLMARATIFVIGLLVSIVAMEMLARIGRR